MRRILIVLVSVFFSASLSAGDSAKTRQQTYTITQLDSGANVASSAHLISDNGVVAGNLQDGSDFSFVWSAQTGFVVLTLGGGGSHRRQRERHRYRRRRYAGGEHAWLRMDSCGRPRHDWRSRRRPPPLGKASRAAVWLSAARAHPWRT